VRTEEGNVVVMPPWERLRQPGAVVAAAAAEPGVAVVVVDLDKAAAGFGAGLVGVRHPEAGKATGTCSEAAVVQTATAAGKLAGAAHPVRGIHRGKRVLDTVRAEEAAGTCPGADHADGAGVVVVVVLRKTGVAGAGAAEEVRSSETKASS
jgi:hypothetical protein